MKNNSVIFWSANLLVVCCVFYSCQKSQLENNVVRKIDIPIEAFTASVKLSEIADDVECIPLETNDSTILDNLTRIINKGGDLYVSDKSSLYKFDGHGNLCVKMSRQGVGPKEYIQISDFQVATDETIWILSRSNKCLYNFELNGALNRKIEFNFWVSKICLIDDENMLLYIGNEKNADNSHQMKLFDLVNNCVIANYFPIDDKKAQYMHVKSNNYFSKENDSIYFFEVFCDTVYSIVQNELTPKYYFNLADKNIPKSFFDTKYRDVMNFFQHLSKNKYAYGTNFFLRSLNYSLMSYYYNGECYLSVISNNDGNSKVGRQILADVFLFNYPIVLNDLVVFLSSDREIIIPLVPDDIMEYANNMLDEKEQSVLKNRINYSGSDQNLVLLKIKIK